MTTSTRTIPAPAESPRPGPARSRPSRTGVAALVLTLTALLAGALALLLLRGGDSVSDTVQPTADVRHVEIDIDAGAVTTTPADELVVAVERSSGWLGSTPSGSADVSGGVLRVTGSCSRLTIGRCHTAVTVALPPGVGLTVRTAAGTIDVDGATAGADLRSVAGAIRVREIGGGTRLRTEAGVIEGTVANGPVVATAAAGSVSLTLTGDVSRVSATTEIGAVVLVLPDAVYAVDAATTLGQARVEVRTDSTSDRHVHARSEVGNVTIRAAAGTDSNS